VYEQQNIELIKSMYEAFGRGDIPSILDKLTTDIKWTTEGLELIPYTGMRHGKAGV
jgi:ketosteroid isomerase-like protein